MQRILIFATILILGGVSLGLAKDRPGRQSSQKLSQKLSQKVSQKVAQGPVNARVKAIKSVGAATPAAEKIGKTKTQPKDEIKKAKLPPPPKRQSRWGYGILLRFW